MVYIGSVLVLAAILAPPAAAAPKRVVSTFLCTDEYVFRLVPRERIAALSYEATDRHPVVSTVADAAKGIPAIHPDTETVLALHPDLVVMYAGVNQRLRDNLKRQGIAVLDVPWADSLADIRKVTTMLGAAFGAKDKAVAMLATMDRELAAARRRTPRPPVRTIFYQPNGYAQTSGYAKDIMRIAGLEDVAPAGLAPNGTGTLPVEMVVKLAPELLVLGGEEKSGSARAYQILHHPALKALKGRTLARHAVLTELMCPGPWSAAAASSFADMALAARRERH
jgi:iron complex transport system substrate-binding protein